MVCALSDSTAADATRLAPRKPWKYSVPPSERRRVEHWPHVASWVEELQEKHGAPGVKQQLAAVRMLLDWLITGQVVPRAKNRPHAQA